MSGQGRAGDSQALVIGGGLAGSALSTWLARAGRRVLLLERERGPHDKVCGEFLSREAGLYLADLGLDVEALGAVPIDAVRLAGGGSPVTARLPFPAHSLSRRVLDEALLAAAEAAGTQVRRGARVLALAGRPGAWEARIEGGGVARGAEVFLATGKHDLRGWRRPAGPQGDLLGFKLHWRLAPGQAAALARHVELLLFPGGYGGLEPVEGGVANLCLLVRAQRFQALGGTWEALLAAIREACPHLRARLIGAEPARPRPLAIAGLPYGHVRQGSCDGAWRLGDQGAVIPSFSGDGMSIALHSARLAARCLLTGGDAAVYQRRLAGDVGAQIRRATLVSQALVRPGGQAVALGAARLAPGLMAVLAEATRIPGPALARAGQGRPHAPAALCSTSAT